ncbi:MAG: methylated-DNA--[protein]-cysteine S-methyltransferase [Dehalococcoidia bacterium]
MAYYDIVESPLGPVLIGGSVAGLHRIEFLRDGLDEERCLALLERDAGEPPVRDATAAAEAARQLEAYWRGERERFDLPLAPRGTAFQHTVWSALQEIGPGETQSYGSVARRLGKPTASRCVGGAIGRNPLAVVVPCHRVMGARGALTGYAAGVERKRWLLDHEARALVPAPVEA